MARAQFDNIIVDDEGNSLSNVTVTVRNAGTSTISTIYVSKTGQAKTNPFSTASDGLVTFWAERGSYDVTFTDSQSPARVATRTLTWESISAEDGGIEADQIDDIPNDIVTASKIPDNTIGLSKLKSEVTSNFLPVGTIIASGSSNAPSGYINCDGSAVSRSTYAALFAAIGVNYGAGDGSSTFNIPNLRGRIPVGRDAGQTEFQTMGQTGGAKTHTLTSSESGVANHGHGHSLTLPSHSHSHNLSMGNHVHYLSGGTVGGWAPTAAASSSSGHSLTAASHTHFVSGGQAMGTGTRATGSETAYRPGGTHSIDNSGSLSVSGSISTSTSLSGYTSGPHLTTINGTVNNPTSTPAIGGSVNNNTGASASSAHNNLQPYQIVNYFIKT